MSDGVKRDWDQHIRRLNQGTDFGFGQQSLREEITGGPTPLVFEEVDEVFEWVLEDAEAQERFVMGDPLVFTEWAWRSWLRDWHCALWTCRGGFELIELRGACVAKSLAWIGGGLAHGAEAGVSEIKNISGELEEGHHRILTAGCEDRTSVTMAEGVLMWKLTVLTGVVVLAVLTGCSSSPYLEDLRYAPRPATARVRPTNSPNAPDVLVAMGSVIGVRRDDPDQHVPESVEIRLRLDNSGYEQVTFDPHSMELVTGQLVNLPAPIVHAPSPIILDPTQSTTVTALFPLTNRIGDIESLSLRWVVQIKGAPVTQTLDFRRVYAR